MNEKTLFSTEKIFNLRKTILLIMFLVIEFFLTIASYEFFKNDWIFINLDLFPRENTTLLFPILKIFKYHMVW